MKFLVDAHLPRRLVGWLRQAGYDAVHTRDLPLGNRTPDPTINEVSLREQRVLVTRDEDFVDSFLIHHKPYKLLLVSTGNIKNAELAPLIKNNIAWIAEAFATYDFIEINRTTITCHL